MIIDSHTHYDLILEDGSLTEEQLFSDLKQHGITHSVQVGIDPASSKWSAEFAARHDKHGVHYTIGIHPSSPSGPEVLKSWLQFLEQQVKGNRGKLLFGVGECGLDYYRHRQPRNIQVASFECQLDAARRHGLPVIIHSRDAMEDTIAILKHLAPVTGIMHCFPGTVDDARRVLDLGLHISFAGNVTYPKAAILHDSAAFVPSDRILVETDAPFLTPVPLRGQKNLPHHIHHTYRFIADLRKQPVEKLMKDVAANFLSLKGDAHATAAS